MVWRQLDNRMLKSEAGPYLTPYTKINSAWITDLNGRAKTLKRKVSMNLYDLGFGNVFSEMTPKHKQGKKKNR